MKMKLPKYIPKDTPLRRQMVKLYRDVKKYAKKTQPLLDNGKK